MRRGQDFQVVGGGNQGGRQGQGPPRSNITFWGNIYEYIYI